MFSHRLHFLIIIGVLTGLFLSVGIFNGFPIVHHDSGTYIRSSFSFLVPDSRPVFFSFIIWLSRSLEDSLWTLAVLQSALTALILVTFFRIQNRKTGDQYRVAVSIAMVLTAFSSLPWFTSYVMADLYTGLAFLVFITLILHWVTLRFSTRIALSIVGGYCLAVHNSNIPIFLAFLVGIAFLIDLRQKELRRAYLVCWIVFIATVTAILVVNKHKTGGYQLSRGSHVFLLARMIDHNVVYKLMRDRCDIVDYALCPYTDLVKDKHGDWFLWVSDSPLKMVGGWANSRAALWPIVIDSVRYYPWDITLGSFKSVGSQLMTFATGSSVRSYDEQNSVYRAIKKHHGGEFEKWQVSRQQRNLLKKDARIVNKVHRPVTLLSILFIVACAAVPRHWIRLEISDRSRVLARSVLLFLFVNAAVCGTLSGANSRYQSRIVWLVIVAALTIVFELRAGTSERCNGALTTENSSGPDDVVK